MHDRIDKQGTNHAEEGKYNYYLLKKNFQEAADYLIGSYVGCRDVGSVKGPGLTMGRTRLDDVNSPLICDFPKPRGVFRK